MRTAHDLYINYIESDYTPCTNCMQAVDDQLHIVHTYINFIQIAYKP